MIFLYLLLSLSIEKISACNYPDDPPLQREKDLCEEDQSSLWNCEDNRCLTTQDSKDLRESYEKCAESTDPKACADRLAAELASDAIDPEEPSDNLSLYGNAAFAALYGLDWAFSKNKRNICVSGKIALGAGALGMAAHLYVKFTAEKNLKKMREKYQKKELNSNPYETQLEAFLYLKEEQELISELGKIRQKVYYIQTAAYGAASIYAGYEALSGNPKCGGTFSSPWIILGSTLAASIYSYNLANQAAEQVEESKENIKILSSLIQQFQDTLIGFCPDGRDDLSSPRCYCYNEDFSENKNRSQSQTCQNIFAENALNLNTDPTNYQKQALTDEKEGCVAMDGTFDQTCKCRSFKDKNDQNACLKSTALTPITSPGLGTYTPYSDVQENVTALTSNGLSSADALDPSQLKQLAIDTNQKRDLNLKKINRIRKKKGLSILQKNAPFLSNIVKKFTRQTPGALSAGRVADILSQNRPRSHAMDSVLEKLNKGDPLKSQKDFKITGGKGFQNLKEGNSEGDESSSLSKFNFQELGKKQYKYKFSPQPTKKTLWTVLGQYYYIHGLKKLFSKE